MKIINKNRIASIALASVLAIMLVIPNVGNAAQASVDLGSASNFAVLAGSTITNTGDTSISGSAGGDVGIFPGTAFTGEESATISGSVYLADNTASTAQDDLLSAYNDAYGRTPVTTIATELGGTTLTPGVYDSAAGTFQVTGTLTLDGEGDPNAVFIFKTDSTLVTASNSVISNINSATSCQTYWVVGSSATLGTDSEFVGTIMASESITATTGASVKGRLLALNGAVTLDTNTITNNICNTTSDTTEEVETTTPPAITTPTDDDEVETTTPPAITSPTDDDRDNRDDSDDADRDDRDDQDESEPVEEQETTDEPETTLATDTSEEPETTDVPETTYVPGRLPATGAAATTAFSGLGALFMLAGFALFKTKK